MKTFLLVVDDSFIGYHYANYMQERCFDGRVIVCSKDLKNNSSMLVEDGDIEKIFEKYIPTVVFSFVQSDLYQLCYQYKVEKYIHVTNDLSRADVVIRTSNCYGSYQKSGFIAECILSAINEEFIHAPFNDSINDWLHISDCCRAIDMIYNFGTQSVYYVCSDYKSDCISIVKKIIRTFQLSMSMIEYDRLSLPVINLNNESIISLGWRPLIDIDDGLEDTIKWYKQSAK